MIGTLQQMFQDYDRAVLASILFEQNNGDIDASIESILQMQKESDQSQELTDKTPESNQENSQVSAQSLSQEEMDRLMAEEQQALEQQALDSELAQKEQEVLTQLMLEEDAKARLRKKKEQEEEFSFDKIRGKMKEKFSALKNAFKKEEEPLE